MDSQEGTSSKGDIRSMFLPGLPTLMRDSRRKFKDIVDGTANTVAMSEVAATPREQATVKGTSRPLMASITVAMLCPVRA